MDDRIRGLLGQIAALEQELQTALRTSVSNAICSAESSRTGRRTCSPARSSTP